MISAKPQVNLFTIIYHYYFSLTNFISADENKEYFVNMKALVEDTFIKSNGLQIVLISHSMGSPMMLYFLNQQTLAWKDKYIKSWVSLAGCFAGTIKAMKVYAEGI